MTYFKLRTFIISIGLFLFASCNPLPYEDVLAARIAEARPAVVQLVTAGGSCSAFHVGRELFITASHCIKPEAAYLIRDINEDIYDVRPILIDRDRDVAVFESSGFGGGTLQIWNERLYGAPKIGSSIVSMGFPGYYLQNFVFEEGTVLDKRINTGVRMLVSRSISYPGESGGPVISLKTGQVVGLVHALAQRVTMLDGDVPVHNTLSLLIDWSEIEEVLSQARKIR